MKNDGLILASAGRKKSGFGMKSDLRLGQETEHAHPANKASRSVSALAESVSALAGLERDEKIAAAIRNLTEPLCESEGMELVCVEYQRETRGRVLRLYIDKPGGIMLDDCTYISRQLGDILDVSTDPNIELMGPYSLEVTSPGSDRPLEKRADFEKFRGRKVKIRIRNSEGQKAKTVQGILSGISGETVEIQTGHQTVSIPFQDIRRARLVPDEA